MEVIHFKQKEQRNAYKNRLNNKNKRNQGNQRNPNKQKKTRDINIPQRREKHVQG